MNKLKEKTNSKQEKRGISLIVLVITIIVIVVLATAVILSIANNNPIENAKSAVEANTQKVIEEGVKLAAMSALTAGNGSIQGDEAYKVLNDGLKSVGYEGEEITSLPKTITIKGMSYLIKEDGTVISTLTETSEDVFTWDGNIITGFSDTATDKDKKNIVIPSRCTGIADYAFDEGNYGNVEEYLEQFESEEMYEVILNTDWNFNTSIESVVIQSTGNFEIGEGAFSSYASISEVVISGDNVTIGTRAFDFFGWYMPAIKCELELGMGTIDEAEYENRIQELISLMELNLAKTSLDCKSLVIDEEAFRYCGLKNITFSCDDLKVGKNAFIYSSLGDVSIECDSITLEEQAFSKSGISNLSMKCSGDCTIGESGFWACNGLKNFFIELTNGGSLDIGNSCFAECESLETVELKGKFGSAKLRRHALHGNSRNLKSITIDGFNRVTLEGNFFFASSYDNPGLTDIYISAEGVDIGAGAFDGATNLQNVCIKGASQLYDYAFRNCTALKEAYFTYPNVMGESPLDGCSSLETVHVNSFGNEETELLSGTSAKIEYDFY